MRPASFRSRAAIPLSLTGVRALLAPVLLGLAWLDSKPAAWGRDAELAASRQHRGLGVLITVPLLWGIVVDLEGLAVSVVLGTWTNDVPSIVHAWRLRNRPAPVPDTSRAEDDQLVRMGGVGPFMKTPGGGGPSWSRQVMGRIVCMRTGTPFAVPGVSFWPRTPFKQASSRRGNPVDCTISGSVIVPSTSTHIPTLQVASAGPVAHAARKLSANPKRQQRARHRMSA